IPLIEKRYTPAFRDKIYSLLTEIREANGLLHVDCRNYLAAPYQEDSLDILRIKEESPFIRRKIIADWLTRGRGPMPFIHMSREKIEDILRLSESPGTKTLDIGGGCRVRKRYDTLSLENIVATYKNDILMDDGMERELETPGVLRGEAFELGAEIVPGRNCEEGPHEFYTALQEGQTLSLRTRKEGDRLQPLGMSGHKKLKEILIEAKIPADLRDRIPVVTVRTGEKEEILWIPGIKKSETFRWKPETKEGIRLWIRPVRRSQNKNIVK
ncbi:MAG: tRNA lysidine(34) synthetase TilS, partial [Fusobacteriaceae bacterium]|nr:tRNA lysidine(34) synthetase TilS [Fusobacteriaceae bacterium]